MTTLHVFKGLNTGKESFGNYENIQQVASERDRQTNTACTVANASTCSSLGTHLLSLSDPKTIKP